MTERCFNCGHPVKDAFEHIAIDCEHDMTPEEISALLKESFIVESAEKQARYSESREEWRKLNPPRSMEGAAA